METINAKIKIREKEYQLFVDSNILGKLGRFCKKNHLGKKIVIIDENTNKLHKRQNK